MIHMGLLNVIRRLALREKLPICEIARRTGLSRNTIKKYLKAGTIEPKFSAPERPSKLDPFADKLAAWLKDRFRKVAQAAPTPDAATCRSGRARVHRVLQPGRRLCPRVARGAAA